MTSTSSTAKPAAASAATAAIIEGIFYATKASNDMISLETGKLIEGAGLKGDRYCQNIGTYSVLQEPGRQLTIISADSVEEEVTLLLGKSEDVDSGEKSSSSSSSQKQFEVSKLRRNIILRGISASMLLDAIGKIIEIGDADGGTARVFVHRNCVPCMYNERLNKSKGLMNKLWYVGGISCQVISSGTIKVGDSIRIVEDTLKLYKIDIGTKPDGFFIHPKEKTTKMIQDGIEKKKQKYPKLLQIDPEGVKRLQKSYNSVGIDYFPKSLCTVIN